MKNIKLVSDEKDSAASGQSTAVTTPGGQVPVDGGKKSGRKRRRGLRLYKSKKARSTTSKGVIMS